MEQSESTILKENDSFVKALFGAIRHGMDSLEHAPVLITKILKNNRWQRRMVEGRGWQIIEFKTFEEFVTTKTPDGLGTSIQRIKDVCQHDTKVRDLIDEVLTKKPGAPVGNKNAAKNKEENKVDNNKHCKGGTDPEYLTSVIARDRPDILDRMKQGEFKSVNAAAIEAGIKKREYKININGEDPIKAAHTILRAIAKGKITREFWNEVLELTD